MTLWSVVFLQLAEPNAIKQCFPGGLEASEGLRTFEVKLEVMEANSCRVAATDQANKPSDCFVAAESNEAEQRHRLY